MKVTINLTPKFLKSALGFSLTGLVLTIFISLNNFPASAWTWAQIIMLSLLVMYVTWRL